MLQIAAQPRETQAILEHLFHRAWERGATAVVGRLETSSLHFTVSAVGSLTLRPSECSSTLETEN